MVVFTDADCCSAQTQATLLGTHKYKGIVHAFVTILKEEGPKGMTRYRMQNCTGCVFFCAVISS